MAKLTISPQFGDITQTRHLSISLREVSGDKDIRVKIENATHSVIATPSSGNDGYIYFPVGAESNLKVNLNIPEHSSQGTISIFAYIEEKKVDGGYKLVDVLPALYYIREKTEGSFPGQILLEPAFINISEVCAIRVKAGPEKKFVFSVNDRRYNMLVNPQGEGSIHFRGKDILENPNTPVVQKIPIYFYSSNDNFISKKFTGIYLTMLPDTIKTHQDDVDPRCADFDPDTWEMPEWCLDNPEPPAHDIGEPSCFAIEMATKTCETWGEEEVTINHLDFCRIHRNDSTLLANGLVLHSFVSVDDSIIDQSALGYNVGRVFIAQDESSIGNSGADITVITNRDVIVGPKTATEDFEIFVDDEIWDALVDVESNNYYVVLFDAVIGYQRLRIREKRIDPYHPYNILVAERGNTNVAINNWLFCVNAVFFQHSDPTLDTGHIDALPFIEDSTNAPLSALNVAIASDYTYVSRDGEAYAYVIAEARANGDSQLFFYSFSIGKSDFDPDVFGWKQLTFTGNNMNPVTKMDANNNLHVFWESDRTGVSQVYYGILGPAAASMGNGVISSTIDKQAELLESSELPFSYVSQPVLVPGVGDEYSPIPLYSSELLVDGIWQVLEDNGGSSDQLGDSHIRDINLEGNALNDISFAYMKLDQKPFLEFNPSDDNPSLEDVDFSQFNYQITFDLKTRLFQDDILLDDLVNVESVDDNEMDTLYDNFKNNYTVSIDGDVDNQPVYLDEKNNRFILGREDNIFDRLIPIAGAFDDAGADDFEISFMETNNTVMHFSLGFMLEKSYFKAVNMQTKAEYCTDQDINIDICDDYISEERHTIYTGRTKLVMFMKTDTDLEHGSDYIIIREFPQVFNVNDNRNFKIIITYSKLYAEEVTRLLNRLENSSETRFVCNIYLLVDDEEKFGESFIVDMSNSLREFDIGLGIPPGGKYLTDKMPPSKMEVFDDIQVRLHFANIGITSPTHIFNESVIVVPKYIREMTNLIRDKMLNGDAVNEAVSVSYWDHNDMLTLGLSLNEEILSQDPTFAADYEGGADNINDSSFLQVPITLSGLNKSANLTTGICDDVHLVWQSNRSMYWDIYYTNSVDMKIPFRLETAITNTESNSIMPAVAVNRFGDRFIAWHDNRNDKYEIYGARSIEGYSCDNNKCESDMLKNFGTEITECILSFVFTSPANDVYHFTIEFYNDSGFTDLYKTISTQDSLVGWTVDGTAFEDVCSYAGTVCTGVQVFVGETRTIAYAPQKDDNIFDRVLYARLVPII